MFNSIYHFKKKSKKKWGKKAKAKAKAVKFKNLSRIQQYQFKLNANLPASERWFQNKWKLEIFPWKPDFTMYQDEYNGIIGSYIGDVVNRGFKYVIEIDGSFHDSAKQQFKDSIRQKEIEAKGFTVIRVKSYDEEGYKKVLEQVCKIMELAKLPSKYL